MTEKPVHNTGEESDEYQLVSLTGQYLLSAFAARREFARFPDPIRAFLDYGCGGGKSLWPAVPLVEPGGQVYGVDVEPKMLEHSEQRIEPARAHRPDLTFEFLRVARDPIHIDLPDGILDIAHTSIVLQEIRERDELDQVAAEIARLLRPGGWFVAVCVGDRIEEEDFVSFTYAGLDANRTAPAGFRACRSVESAIVWEHDRHWTRSELGEACAAAGMRVDTVVDVVAPPELIPFPNEAWRGWKDELSAPPLLLVRATRLPS